MDNIIDFLTYKMNQIIQNPTSPDELDTAIQNLIQRLREHNPIT